MKSLSLEAKVFHIIVCRGFPGIFQASLYHNIWKWNRVRRCRLLKNFYMVISWCQQGNFWDLPCRRFWCWGNNPYFPICTQECYSWIYLKHATFSQAPYPRAFSYRNLGYRRPQLSPIVDKAISIFGHKSTKSCKCLGIPTIREPGFVCIIHNIWS